MARSRGNVSRKAGADDAALSRLKDLLRDYFQDVEESYEEEGPRFEMGLTTGFVELDGATGGLHPGELVLVAGPPGAGKTTLGFAVARRFAASTGLGVILFSLQSDRKEVVRRFMAAEGDVPRYRLVTELEDSDWPKLTRAAGSLASLPLFVDDRWDLEPADIDQAIAGLGTELPVRLAVVDHSALLRPGRGGVPEGPGLRSVVQSLVRVAREREVCVLLLAELTGPYPAPVSRKPGLADLAYLGLSGREVDAVWLVDRLSSPGAVSREEALVRVEAFVPGTGFRGWASLVLSLESLELRDAMPLEATLGLLQ